MTTARVVLLTDAAMDRHTAPGHPERPERRAAAVDGVLDGAAAAGAQVLRPRVEIGDDSAIEGVHPRAFLAALDAAEARGGGWLDADTYLVPGSMAAARLAAAATVAATLSVAGGEASLAFAAVRPPGHHAASERATGFCVLNSVAVAAIALRTAGLASRVAIIDWDVHHGDGTQAIFDADAELCYASTHQWPLYPGTGAASERGIGRAAGTKHNRPLPPGSGDAPFLAAWRDELLPAVEAFAPEAILVSSGYDAHRDDPLAQLVVTESGFREVARLLGGVAARAGLPGVALTLEGGYALEAVRRSSAATAEGLLAGLASASGRE